MARLKNKGKGKKKLSIRGGTKSKTGSSYQKERGIDPDDVKKRGIVRGERRTPMKGGLKGMSRLRELREAQQNSGAERGAFRGAIGKIFGRGFKKQIRGGGKSSFCTSGKGKFAWNDL